jgi:hypothetical protein
MSQSYKEVNGFKFTEEEAVVAEKELSAIKYIDSQIKSGDEKKLLDLYRSLIKQLFFKTQIGYDYLRTLQKYLLSSDGIEDVMVPPIPVEQQSVVVKTEEPKESTKTKKDKSGKKQKVQEADDSELQKMVKKYKSYFHYATIICVVFLLTIGGMFYILSTTDSPTIVNYENQIIDKYSSWEEELNERELEINERERALGTNAGESNQVGE